MRDKLKNPTYFNKFIVETESIISKSRQRFIDNKIPLHRLSWHKYNLMNHRFSIVIAKFSEGIEVSDIKREFEELINDISPAAWPSDISKVRINPNELADQYMVEPHNKMLSLLSLAFLLRVDSKLLLLLSNIIDHDNISDNLYEFILKAEFSDRKRKRPEEYDPKHSVILKVYRNMRLAIEQTDKTEAQKLIKHFLEKDFYHKHSGFYNLHKEKFDLYYGYWSFEAAAITCIMDLDDSSYRDNQYYPKDLVDFYRSTSLC